MLMTTYVSLLRGINVGGQKLIKMDALRKLYEGMGFHNVTTYLQSGNVLFKAEGCGIPMLERNISIRIEQDFGFKVPVIVLTTGKLDQVIDNNPLLKDPEKDESFFHVTFLSSSPLGYDNKAIENRKQDGEKIIFSDDVIYLYCPNGYGRTKLTNNFLETKLKVGATTRNWKTAKELLKIAEAI